MSLWKVPILLLLKHLLILHLLQLLLLLLLLLLDELRLRLRSGRLHGGGLRANHCRRIVGRHHTVVLRLKIHQTWSILMLGLNLIPRLNLLTTINLLVAGALKGILGRHASTRMISKLI